MSVSIPVYTTYDAFMREKKKSSRVSQLGNIRHHGHQTEITFADQYLVITKLIQLIWHMQNGSIVLT